MSWWRFWQDDERDDEPPPDYYAEGVDLARQERYHEALTSFRLSLREQPDDLATLEQMAVVYTRIGMTDEALKTYGRVLARDAGRAASHYGAGFLLLNRGRESEAVEHLEAFLQRQPDTADAERHVEHARRTLERLREPDGDADGSADDEGESEGDA